MTRAQMFGTESDGIYSSGARLTLFFPEKPREVPATDCTPGAPCRLESPTLPFAPLGGWRYYLCPAHTAWYWEASS